MYESARLYRIALHRETEAALKIGVIDQTWKSHLFKALVSIKTDLPTDVRQRVLDGHFLELNKRLK